MADGRIVIDTKIDNTGLVKGIGGLEKVTVGALNSVKKTLATAGITVGVAAAVKGVQSLIKSTGQLTDHIDKQSQKIGMSRKGYQEWKYILDRNGASVDGLQMSIKTLSSAVDEAINGNKSYQSYLDRLGVTIHDTNGAVKSQEALFNEVFVALTKVTNETERTNLASKLLGRAATELAPALNAGADSVEELRKQAYDLNLVLDDATVNIGVRWSDLMTDFNLSMRAATSRAFAPFVDKVSDLQEAFTKKAIPAIESFLSTAVKVGLSIPPVFNFVKAVVKMVMKEISEALEEPWEKMKALAQGLLDLSITQGVISFVVELAGSLWEGLKKGINTGDWGDFWQAAVGVAQFAIGIYATLQVAQMAGVALWSAIQSSLGGAGFSTANLMSGAIAMLSVGLAVVEAMQKDDYSALAANMIAAIIAGFAVGGLTGNMQAGVLTFTVVLNLKLGEILGFGKAFETIKKSVTPFEGGSEAAQIGHIIGSVEGLFTKWGVTGSAGKKVRAIAELELGRNILEGLGVGLKDIEKIGEKKARDLLYAIKDELGIQSPAKEAVPIGVNVLLGIAEGLAEAFPQLTEASEKMIDELTNIWVIKPTVEPISTEVSVSGGKVGGLFDDIKKAWAGAVKELKEEFQSFPEYLQDKFKQIPMAFADSISSGVRALGDFFATQKQVVEDLSDQINSINERLADAQDDLADAQEKYNRALLSGDKDAIKNAEKKLKSQEKTVKAYEEEQKALKEQKKAVESGEEGMKRFAKTILSSIANTLYGLGAELLARAAVAAVTFNWGGAAAATAGSAVAFGAAIALDAWAGSFAEGGIVGGSSYSGDRLTANVNSGELILNLAQQENLATALIAAMKLAENRGGIVVNLSGSQIYGLNEEAVGRAIYGNIRQLQLEGALGRW